MKKTILFLCMFFLSSSVVFSASDSIRIYFIGNSVTGNGETSRPAEMVQLAKSIGKRVYAEQSAYC
ncbi:MAG: hypothetical protein JNL74_10525, partial [Fibrobacteres bacterium]|nr:hypothetical protein [Fibrobacterota bacterium]